MGNAFLNEFKSGQIIAEVEGKTVAILVTTTN
jgi:hypothetical protein